MLAHEISELWVIGLKNKTRLDPHRIRLEMQLHCRCENERSEFMTSQLEALNERIWGDKVTLATTNHALGGIGAGLLMAGTRRWRPLAWGLVAFSLGAHVYAWLNRKSEVEARRA